MLVVHGRVIRSTRRRLTSNPATLVNNTPGSGRQRDGLEQNANGRWQVATSDTFDDKANENQCAPEG